MVCAAVLPLSSSWRTVKTVRVAALLVLVLVVCAWATADEFTSLDLDGCHDCTGPTQGAVKKSLLSEEGCVDKDEELLSSAREFLGAPVRCPGAEPHCFDEDFGPYVRLMCGVSCGGCSVANGKRCSFDDVGALNKALAEVRVRSVERCADVEHLCGSAEWGAVVRTFCSCTCADFF